ncbi:T9SS type A sorting domain-containing protein [bacterium]|nr:T9SS type A sorting domain-containing protein [bacterium]
MVYILNYFKGIAIKTSICGCIIFVLAVFGCIAQEDPTHSVIAGQITNEAELLDFYRQYSEFTDPGEYEYLYENLPESLPDLCSLIRAQTIHPYGDLQNYKHLIPEERWEEYYQYPTVESVLKGLMSYDSRGLVKNRKIEDRLVLICRHNALLLASILKYRGIPARVRYGFAQYLVPNFHTMHVICEVWNKNDNRWMLVDPTAGSSMIDFSRTRFDFSNDVWLKMQNNEINPNSYGNPGQYTGFMPIMLVVCADLAAVLGTEHTTLEYPPIMDYAYNNDNQLAPEHIKILNQMSELMKSVDADNFSKLQDIYNNTPEIQITLSLETTSVNVDNTGQVEQSPTLSQYSLSQNYPNPFNPVTRIQFSIPREANVQFHIINSLGETVEIIMNDVMPPGTHVIEYNADELPSGVYFYCLESGSFRQAKKMTVLQ